MRFETRKFLRVDDTRNATPYSAYLAKQLRVQLFQLIIETLISLLKAALLSILITVGNAIRTGAAVTATTAEYAAHFSCEKKGEKEDITTNAMIRERRLSMDYCDRI